jgi:hypothetical protein
MCPAKCGVNVPCSIRSGPLQRVGKLHKSVSQGGTHMIAKMGDSGAPSKGTGNMKLHTASHRVQVCCP